MTPLVLMYNLDAQAEARLAEVCEGLGFRARRVMPWEYGQPIGALAGLPAGKRAGLDAATFTEPMLVMCHMLSPDLDAFLRAMRTGGVPRVALKAVLTPNNITWNSCQLRDELTREHEAFVGKGGG